MGVSKGQQVYVSQRDWSQLVADMAETKAYAKAAKESTDRIDTDHEQRLRSLEKKTIIIWTIGAMFWAALALALGWLKSLLGTGG